MHRNELLNRRFLGLLTGNEHLSTRTLLDEGWRVSVDWSIFVGFDGTSFVDRFSDDINDSSESFGADWHKNGVASVSDGLSTNEAFGGVEGDRSDVVATQVLGDLQNEPVLSSLYLEGVKNWRKLTLKMHVHDGTNNLRNLSVCLDGSGKAA